MKERNSLGECFNLALNIVTSEDLIVANDDMLIFNRGWLSDLYKIYKRENWFALVPFIVPHPKSESRPNYAPEDVVWATGHGINSYFRISNIQRIRDVGGFKWIKASKDREGQGFSSIVKKYKGKTGVYLKVRMMDMSYCDKELWDFQKKRFNHFIKTGEVIQYETVGSDKSLVVYSGRDR